MYSPGAAGALSVTAALLWWFACTYPLGRTERPGDTLPAWKLSGVVSAPLSLTITWYGCPGGSSNGTWALICPGLTELIGACIPPIITNVPPSVTGSGIAVLVSVCPARY